MFLWSLFLRLADHSDPLIWEGAAWVHAANIDEVEVVASAAEAPPGSAAAGGQFGLFRFDAAKRGSFSANFLDGL